MTGWIAALLLAPFMLQQADVEARIIEYLRTEVEPGEPIVVSDVLLRIMEAEPRLPRFFERDAKTGEITRVDMDAIRSHPQFGQALERTLGGWEGRPVPAFVAEAYDGRSVTPADLAGRPYMIYVWFTNCPPCVQTAPILESLYEEYAPQDFEIVAANADRILEMPYDDAYRQDYVERERIRYLTVHLNGDMQAALGGTNVFPTMFFVGRDGIILRHLVSFQERPVLEEAIEATLR
jgi:thiol-disulfide isomerase/thioredoxin